LFFTYSSALVDSEHQLQQTQQELSDLRSTAHQEIHDLRAAAHQEIEAAREQALQQRAQVEFNN
jgi:F0F1-type ATP synthase membrane subunit b/b'